MASSVFPSIASAHKWATENIDGKITLFKVHDQSSRHRGQWMLRYKQSQLKPIDNVLNPNLTRQNKESHLDVIWDALHKIPIKSDPDKDLRNNEMTDEEWDDVTTAMAWIAEDLNAKRCQ